MTRGQALWMGLAVLASGCFERALEPSRPCTRARTVAHWSLLSPDELDLLLVVDNSNSMFEAQQTLVRALPRLVDTLGSGDRDGDGLLEFLPIHSMHIGVITTDMGSGGFAVPTCGGGAGGFMFGDDGVMRTQGHTASPGCMASYPSVFEFLRRATDPSAYAMDVSCVATVGTTGCGMEQQLDATLKALSPSAAQAWTRFGYEPPLFFDATFGHGDGMNAGFVRASSILAIVLISDEEDCSALDPELFDLGSPRFATADLSQRCLAFPDALHPVERYVEGLLQLRGNPRFLVFTAIVGVPLETLGGSYEAMLAHPEMTPRVDPSRPPAPLPSCERTGVFALPPRRIVEVAQGLAEAGAATAVRSICEPDFEAALDVLVDDFAVRNEQGCLSRSLNTDARGVVACGLLELLPATGAFTACADLPGRTLVHTESVSGATRELCEIRQRGRADVDDEGWWYEDSSSDPSGYCGGGRLHPPGGWVDGAIVWLDCNEVIVGGPRPGSATLGSYCDRGSPGSCGTSPVEIDGRPVMLQCDSFDRTCQVPCEAGESDACLAAGLTGHVCDTRSWSVVVGADEEGISDAERMRRLSRVPGGEAGLSDTRAFCVNPTCL